MSLTRRPNVVPLEGRLVRGEDESIQVCSPTVGHWKLDLAAGAVVSPGDPLGDLEVLTRRYVVRAPQGATGRVRRVHHGSDDRVVPVDWATVLVELEGADTVRAKGSESATPAARVSDPHQVFGAPATGRCYLRPAPDQPVFLSAGSVVAPGDVVALVEVMKTFHRVTFEHPSGVGSVRVTRVLAEHDSDIQTGDPLFEFEPV